MQISKLKSKKKLKTNKENSTVHHNSYAKDMMGDYPKKKDKAHVLQKEVTQEKFSKKSFVFKVSTVLIMLLSFATMFYFYNTSQKITDKKQSILSLYNKLQVMKTIHIKSEIMLKSLSTLDEKKEKGTVYFLVDVNNELQTQSNVMTQNYLDKKVLGYTNQSLANSQILILTLIMMIIFVIIRLLILNREKNIIKPYFYKKGKVVDESLRKNKKILQLPDYS